MTPIIFCYTLRAPRPLCRGDFNDTNTHPTDWVIYIICTEFGGLSTAPNLHLYRFTQIINYLPIITPAKNPAHCGIFCIFFQNQLFLPDFVSANSVKIFFCFSVNFVGIFIATSIYKSPKVPARQNVTAFQWRKIISLYS